MKEKYCANCKRWTEDLETNDGVGICSKRAIHGGLTNFNFVCENHKYDLLILFKIIIYRIKLIVHKR